MLWDCCTCLLSWGHVPGLHHCRQRLLDLLQRFGVEGCEAVLVGLETLVARCAQQGVRRIELGMPHRGRLNVLCNILKKPPGALYGEMEGGQSEFHVGDVKYHLGQSASLEYANEVAVCVLAGTCLGAVIFTSDSMYYQWRRVFTTECRSSLS